MAEQTIVAQEMEALRADVRLLKARADIIDCVHRYARGIDRNDDELVLSAFFEDAVITHALHHGSPDAFVAWVRPRMTSYATYSHCITNHTCTLAGETARTESYCTIHTVEGDGRTLNLWGLRYLDQFECRAAVWRIARRVVVMDWYSPAVGTQDGAEFARASRYLPSTHDRTDPSYLPLPD